MLGQTTEDRPDVISKVFQAKLQDLKESFFQARNIWKHSCTCLHN